MNSKSDRILQPFYLSFDVRRSQTHRYRYRQPSPEQWERFIQFMFGQVRELLTNYGKIDILWFDGAWERTPEQWQASALNELALSQD